MECIKFDYNVYFKVDQYLGSVLNLDTKSAVEILTAISEFAKKDLGIPAISESEIKDFIKNSFLPNEIKDKIMKGKLDNTNQFGGGYSDNAFGASDSSNDTSKNDDHLINFGEWGDDDSDTGFAFEIATSKIKTITSLVEVDSLNSLYNNYFSGNILAFNKFMKIFSKNLFASTFVSFDKNNPFIVKTDEQVQTNVDSLKNNYIQDIILFLDSENVAHDDTLESINEGFHSLSLQNSYIFNKMGGEPDGLLAKAYNAYVAINNFEILVPNTSSTLKSKYDSKEMKYKYYLATGHKMKNNFSDSLINMVDEISKVTILMIEYTPILNGSGKIVSGRYLKSENVTNVVAKLKNLQESYTELSMSIRENPEERIGDIMRKVLLNPGTAINQGKLNKFDIDVIRTVYNYFYKRENEEPGISSQMNDDTVSLVTIKNNDYKVEGVNYNIIADAITTTIDKTIGQKYVTLDKTIDGVSRQITQDKSVNKYYNQMIKGFTDRSNQGMELPDSSNSLLPDLFDSNMLFYANTVDEDFRNINISLGDGFEFEIDPLTDVQQLTLTNAVNRPVKKNLSVEDWANAEQGNFNNIQDKGKRNFAKTVVFASKVLGVNMYHTGGEMIQHVNLDPEVIVSHLLYLSARVLYFKNLKEKYNQNKLSNNDITLNTEYIKHSEIIENDKFKPFVDIKNKTLLLQLSNAMAIVKGDMSSAISRNSNGDGLPNTSLLNLIGDDRTIFKQLREGDVKDMLSGNLFVQNDNFKLIKDTIFRSDIKDFDGKIKNIKKFSAGEIMHQAIFSDFWGSLSDDATLGIAMMEPTVFADKSGQAMKAIDMNSPIHFKYEGFDTQGATLLQLLNQGSTNLNFNSRAEELHYYSMKSQYQKLYDKLMGDYKTMLKNVVSTNDEIFIREALNLKENENTSQKIDSLSLYDVLKILTHSINGIKLKLADYRGNVDVQNEIHFVKSGETNGYNLKKFEEYNILNGDTNKYKRRQAREDKKFLKTYIELCGNFIVLKGDGTLTPQMDKIVNFYLTNVVGVSSTDVKKLETAKNEFVEKWVNEDGTLKPAINYDMDGETQNINELTEADVYSSDYGSKLVINPLLQFMQTSNKLLMGNYNLAMVGSPAAHVMKVDKKTLLNTFTEKIKKIDESGNEVTVDNPAFKKNKQAYLFNLLKDQLGSEELAFKEIWEEVEESARTIAMHKRMVAYQAKIHPFTQGLISGVTKNMKMMVVNDVTHNLWNTVGDDVKQDVADGSGWVTMAAAILFKGSMGDTGTDSVSLKAIRHAIDGDTGAAHLDKYAILVLSNEVLRLSEVSKMPWANLNRIMLDSVKFDKVFNGYIGNLFGSKYMFEPESYSDIQFPGTPVSGDKNSSDAFNDWINNITAPHYLNGKSLKYVIPGVNILTELTGIGHIGDNKYIVKKRFTGPGPNDYGITTEEGYTMILNDNGDPTGEGYKTITLESLYDVWNDVFGGLYTVTEQKGNAQISINGIDYSYDDSSNEALATMMNNTVMYKDLKTVNDLKAIGINEKIAKNKSYNQGNYFQPLKHALIWQLNNASGMKNGAKNVNSNEILYSDDRNQTVNFFETNSMHYGIQGNFDHKFSEEHEARVTEATQVISAAEINGYMTHEVSRLYKSLSAVVANSIKDYKKAYLGKNGEIAEVLTRSLVRIMSTKDRKGIAQAYSDLVMEEIDKLYADKSEVFEYDKLEYKAAFSDGNFYSAMVSMISGALNNGVIKRDLPGIAAVLSQCHDSIMVADSHKGVIAIDNLLKEKTKELFETFKKDRNQEAFNANLKEFKESLTSKQYKDATVINIPPMNTTFGSRYNIDNYDILRAVGENDFEINFEITSPKMYYAISSGDFTEIPGYEQLGDLKNVKLNKLKNIPRNLIPLRLEFISNNGAYSLNEMDLDSSKAIWMLKDYINGNDVPIYIKELIDNTVALNNLNPKDFNGIKKALIAVLQKHHTFLQKGQFIFEGKILYGNVKIHAGELILPNYNKSKFGIEDGMNVSDIDEDYFYNKLPGNLNVKQDVGSFHFISRSGRHLNLVKADQISKIPGFDALLNKKMKTKIIDGVAYYVDNKGTIIFEKTDDCEIWNIGGRTYATYKNIEDVHKMHSSDYFLGVGYNFSKGDMSEISQYIDKYDLKSKKYIVENNGGLDGVRSAQLYNSDNDARKLRIAKNMMASWVKQLQMIGARIPAQSLQSFMAMKIVGFTDKDVNRAYVPIKKNYLDGSDFDIDKIYMMGFSVNKNGKFQTWSDYFDFDHFEKSLEMPFPDGLPKEIKAVDIFEDGKYTGENVDFIEQYVTNYLNGDNTDPGSFDLVVDLLNDVAEKGGIPDTFDEDGIVYKYINSYFMNNVTDLNKLTEAFKNAAMGSLYKISKAPVNMMASNRGVDMNDPKDGAKKSPKTWAAMQWSMDNYATLPSMKEENNAGKAVIGIAAVGIKNFCALSHLFNLDVSELNQKLEKDYNEFVKIRLARDGEYAEGALNSRNIDYTASSYSYMELKYNKLYKDAWEKLNFSDRQSIKNELERMCNPKSFDLYNEETKQTKRIITTFLANVNFDDKPILNLAYDELINDLEKKYSGKLATNDVVKINALKKQSEEQTDIIPDSIEVIDARKLDDYSLTLSALLSSATDNAKELILSKINAGPELAGTYVYIIVQGMSFSDITDFMVSSTVDAIVAKSKSNIFMDNKSSIDSAIKYYKNGVNVKSMLTPRQIDTLEYQIWSDQKIREQFFDLLTDEGKGEFTHTEGSNQGNMKMFTRNFTKYFKHLKSVEEFEKLYNKVVTNPFTEEYHKFENQSGFDLYMDFDQYPSSTTNNSYLNRPLRRLLKELRKREDDLKSKVNIDKVLAFETMVEESKELQVLGKRLGINGGMGTDIYSHYSYHASMSNYFSKKVHDLDVEIVASILGVDKGAVTDELINDYTDMSKFHKLQKTSTDQETHDKRNEKVKRLYDLVKSKFNIIDVELKLPHFNSMMSSQSLAMDVFGKVSTRYEKTISLMNDLINEGFVSKDNGVKRVYDEDTVKKISNFVISDLVNSFFVQSEIKFTIPKGTYYYDEHLNYSQAKSDVELNLGTKEGRASFKLFMELSKHVFKRMSDLTQGNKFLDYLVTDSQKDPLTGIENDFMKLDLDMNNIKTEYDEMQLQEIIIGFEYLKQVSANKILKNGSIADLFFIYNLLVNNNTFGKNSFTKVFENSFSSGEKSLITEFMKFVGDIDNSPNTKLGSMYPDTNLETLAMMIAPVMQQNDYGSDQGLYVKQWDKNLKRYVLYKRVDPDPNAEYPKYEYKLYKDLTVIPDIPTKLYLQDAQLKSDYVINNLTGFINVVAKKFYEQFEKANINLTIEC